MKYRSTLIYLAAAVLLLGLYLYELHRDKEREKIKEGEKKLFPISTKDVDTISLKKGSQTLKVQRTDEKGKKRWKITSPIETPADEYAVFELKKKLADLKYQRLITDSPKDLPQFGLDPPAFSVGYKAGKETGVISFGKETPIEYGTYARVDQGKRVYLIETQDKAALDKTLFDLRRKRLFTISLDHAKRFVINRKGGPWTLIKEKDGWSFEDDRDYPVDPQKVNSLLVRFTMARAVTFEAESSKDLAPFGLVEPRARITISDGKRAQTIRLGNPVKDKKSQIYAKMEGRPPVVTVEGRLLDDLPQQRDAVKKEDKIKAGDKKGKKAE